MDANHIRQVVSGRYTKKLWAVHYEVGLCKGGKYRADILALHMGGGIDVIEVKSSVADFKADKKMGQYRPYADKLYLACSAEVYAKVKDLVLPGIGVYIVGERSIKVVKRAKYQAIHGKTRLNLMARVAYRSADATLHTRKSKTAGAKYVAEVAVTAIQAMKVKRTRESVLKTVETALKGLV